MPGGRPNFLCIVTDQQRADHTGFAGNPVLQTPSLDRIAASGVRFPRTYVANPLCQPSRATLFTGLNPRGHRVRTNGIPLDPALPVLPGILRDAGYRTHAAGKIHLHLFVPPPGADPSLLRAEDFPETRRIWDEGRIERLPSPYYGLETADFVGGHGHWIWGDYARWAERARPGAIGLLHPDLAARPRTGAEASWVAALPEELHVSRFVADRAIEFLRREGRGPRPFFLWCSFPDPHHPYCPPLPWADLYDPASAPLPAFREAELDRLAPFFREAVTKGIRVSGRAAGAPTRLPEAHLREIIARTFAMIALADRHIGRVLDALEETGLQDDTVVVFLSDHGELMGDHGLMNKGPFHFEGLLRVSFVWSWPGRFPAGGARAELASLLDFAPTVLDLAGVPIPAGPSPAAPGAQGAMPAWPGRSLAEALRGGAPPARDAVLVENDEDYLGLRLRTLVTERHKITFYPGQAFGELFDLRNDPGETENLWAEPGAAGLKRDLLLRLLEALAETDPPLPRKSSHA